MKSIIEQASSIIKAIEKAWNQAEKPKEFSIKIFEQEERNFFGMSTKPAKIGIFFGGDKPSTHEKPTSKPHQKIKECRPASVSSSAKSYGEYSKATADRLPLSKVSPITEEKITTKPASQPAHKTQPTHHKQAAPHAKHDNQSTQPRVHTSEKTQPTKAVNKAAVGHNDSAESKQPRRMPTAWNDTMIATAHNWLKQTLSLMGLPAINFNSEVAGKNLKLTFDAPLIADPVKEKQLFRSFAHLIVSSLRNQYKQEIKNLKVVLIRPE